MSEFMYNILWIDDEHERLQGTKGRAKRHGINLVSFKSLEGGLSELVSNYPYYDGIILDGKIFQFEDDAPGSEDIRSAIKAKERINKL